MSAERLSIDANVFVYAVDRTAGTKHGIAREIVRRSPLVDNTIALQVLGEFFVAATRRYDMTRADAAALARSWSTAYATCTASSAALRRALGEAAASRHQYWDALLLATLRESGCTVLLSEDMQNGADYDGVRVLNPFLGDGLPDEIEALLDHD